jgi:hypothetical protein
MLCVNCDGTDRSIVLVGACKNPRRTDMQFWERNGIEYLAINNVWMNVERSSENFLLPSTQEWKVEDL